jgi:predicted transcriptional regulator
MKTVTEDNETMSQTKTMTVRLPVEVAARLEGLARSTDRTKSFLAAQAIAEYVAAQGWQVCAVEKAVREADEPEARFIDHEYVVSKRPLP